MRDAVLSFYDCSRMGYHPAAMPDFRRYPAEFMLGDYPEGGGVGKYGEFGIRWNRFDGHGKWCPRLEMFSDSWGVLATAQGRALVDWLASKHGKDPQPEEVRAFLLSIGCEDVSREAVPS